MDQFAQTNDLQQAIENVANGSKPANSDTQFGIPPMPPANNAAPVDMMFTMAPTPTGAPEMPKVEPLVPAEETTPSAEQILSESINMTGTPVVGTQESVSEENNVTSGDSATEAPVTESISETMSVETTTSNEELKDVKQSILRDLLPLLDKTEKTAEEKWDIYKEALGTMHDVKTVEGAYKAASGISDEAKKADALFELMKSI